MSSRLLTSVLISIFLLSSCGNPDEATQSSAENSSTDSCLLAVVDSSLAVKWTAFKTTEKIGVGGTFDIVQINGLKKGESAKEIIEGASFEIPVSSVNSQNQDRDKKIFVHFFSTMNNTGLLAGQVLSVNENTCNVGLVMNNVRDTIPFELNQEGNRISLNSSIDLAKWNALTSVDALNNECYDLHNGADGISKLWPDVNIEITASLSPDCN